MQKYFTFPETPKGRKQRIATKNSGTLHLFSRHIVKQLLISNHEKLEKKNCVDIHTSKTYPFFVSFAFFVVFKSCFYHTLPNSGWIWETTAGRELCCTTF